MAPPPICHATLAGVKKYQLENRSSQTKKTRKIYLKPGGRYVSFKTQQARFV